MDEIKDEKLWHHRHYVSRLLRHSICCVWLREIKNDEVEVRPGGQPHSEYSAVQPVIHDTLSGLGARVITYKDRGLLVKAVDGNGWWLFEKVFEFSRNGRPFAIHTSAGFAHVEKGKIVSIAGCKMNVVIYDEDGDGSFETVVPYAFKVDHVPAWVPRQEEK